LVWLILKRFVDFKFEICISDFKFETD